MEISIFPIGETKHIIFCVIACIFFLLQFFRTKHWNQLILAAAIPLTLLVYIDTENKTLFHAVGIVEAVLLFAALIVSIVQGHKEAVKEKAEKAAKEAAKKAAQETEVQA